MCNVLHLSQSVYSCVSLEKTSAMSVGVSCVGEVTSMSLDWKLDFPPPDKTHKGKKGKLHTLLSCDKGHNYLIPQ